MFGESSESRARLKREKNREARDIREAAIDDRNPPFLSFQRMSADYLINFEMDCVSVARDVHTCGT